MPAISGLFAESASATAEISSAVGRFPINIASMSGSIAEAARRLHGVQSDDPHTDH